MALLHRPRVGAMAAIVLLARLRLRRADRAAAWRRPAVGLFSSFATRQIGGHTGDTIGAAQQIGEALLLAGLSAGWTYILV